MSSEAVILHKILRSRSTDKKIYEALRFIDREVAKLEIDNVQMSDIYNRNPKGIEIDRLKTIAHILEEVVRR